MSQENNIFEKRVNKIIDRRFGMQSPEQLLFLMSQFKNLSLEELEKKFIQTILEQEGYCKSKSAERLNITWQSLDRRIKKHKIILR